MFRFKIDVLAALKDAGYTSYQVKSNSYIGSDVFRKIRKGQADFHLSTLNKICNLLEMQPGDVIEWVQDEDEMQAANDARRKPRTTRKAEEPGE